MTTKRTMCRRDRRVPAGRALHVVDIENLVGGSGADAIEVDRALAHYEQVVRPGENDLRVVACGASLVFPVHDRWAGASIRKARGVDGADRILLDEASVANVVGRFDRVVVASGDHVFASLVVDLDAAGVEVVVVSRRTAMSRLLAVAAPFVWYFEDVAMAA